MLLGENFVELGGGFGEGLIDRHFASLSSRGPKAPLFTTSFQSPVPGFVSVAPSASHNPPPCVHVSPRLYVRPDL